MLCNKEKADETGYAAEPYVNGVDLPTAVNNYISQHKEGNNSGMFCVVNGTTALNYPKAGNFYIEYIADRRFSSGVLVTATELGHPEKIYRCIINDLGQVVNPWTEYKSCKIYRFNENVEVDQAWASLYYNSVYHNITDAGDLTTKDVFIEFNNSGGYTCMVSLDQVMQYSITVSYIRANPGYALGTLVVYVYDR